MPNILNKFSLVLTIVIANNAIAIKVNPKLVSEYIEKLKGQTEIYLRNQNMGDQEAAALAEALLQNKTVHTPV